ncbi:MAG TPA: XylR family transcriptional regulator [Candidatus Cybelea sp.]|nr:XylR family transcriptional regulator [Candidatus Cybelea sp.]
MSRIPKVLLLVESSRGSGRSLLRGIANYAHHHGPWSCYWEPGGLEKVWPKLRSLDVDGIILRDVDKLEEVLAFGIPAVVIGHGRKEVSGLVNVVTDSEAIGQMAAEHLLACGFKQFAYCGTCLDANRDVSWSQLRRQSFAKRIQQAGFDYCDFSFAQPSESSSWPQELGALSSWLQSLPKPLGLMACNDDRACQLMEACKLASVSVPGQLGIVGVDNDEVVCGLSDPPLSSVAVNFERAGYEAAGALDCLMRGKKPVPARILVRATHMVVRRSTDFVAVEDDSVGKALRYIRANASGGELDVSAVARSAGVSRRSLEKRFRRELGYSVLKEIRRVRTDKIAQLLVETQMPVWEIAEELGFDDIQHFARYFRAAKSMSPLAYRKIQGAPQPPEPRAQNGDSFTQSGVVARRHRPVKSKA